MSKKLQWIISRAMKVWWCIQHVDTYGLNKDSSALVQLIPYLDMMDLC